MGREVPQAERQGHRRQRHRRRRRDGRFRPGHAGRHQPAERSDGSAKSTAASRCRCRTSARRTTTRRPARCAASSRGRRRKPSAARSSASLAGELHDRHARGDRPRVGPAGAGGQGHAAGARSRSTSRRSRKAAPIWSACTSSPIRSSSSSASSRPPITTTSSAREYEAYTRNALVQLRRVREGTQIEEDHMRNRQMIVRWLMANTKAIEERHARRQDVLRDGRPQAFREGVGRLLAEVQRIKSEGDYAGREEAVRHLRHPLRPEAARRGRRRAWTKLNLPSYTGFVMPKLTPVTGADGAITDVKISYPMDLTTQMLEWGAEEINRVRCEGARVRGCEGAKVRRCEGARVRRCEGARACSP